MAKKLDLTNTNIDNAFLIADIHLGVRSGVEEWQENIKNYFTHWFIPMLKRKKNDNSCLFVLGDVFDDRKNINIAVNDLAINIFERLAAIMPVYIINGNHDLYKKTNKGVTSLKSIDLIPNVYVITEPTIITLANKKTIIAIPYLGDYSQETKVLVQNSKCNYAFMHTDITKMKYDNNMSIIAGVDVNKFEGKIYSGHIHKRQENDNVVYVGSPYQLRRSDIGNQKGIYQLFFNDDTIKFTENNYSPVFQKIFIEDFVKLSKEEQLKLIDNNYNDIIIKSSDLKKYKRGRDVYNIGNESKAKRFTIEIWDNDNAFIDTSTNELSIAELESANKIENIIISTINSLNVTDDNKEHLKELSKNYLETAQEELKNSYIDD